MLTYEQLLAHAKNRNMPTGKWRGIVREYLQVLVLKSIYTYSLSRNLYFMGGTAMRLFYNLPRFSEDLDFNAKNVSMKDLEKLLEKIKGDLLLAGFQVEISAKEKGTLLQGKLKLTNILKAYRVVAMPDEKLMVKIELNRPAWNIPAETRVLSAYGEMFPVVLLERGAMFAEKIAALLERKLARDVYDIFFMFANNFPVNEDVLKARSIKNNYIEVIAGRIKSFSHRELEEFARKIEPFLFDPQQAKIVCNIPEYISQ